MRSYILFLLLFGCAGEQIVSDPPDDNVLLWRANHLFVVSARQIAKDRPTEVHVGGVGSIIDVDASSRSVAISAVPSNLQGCKLLMGTPAAGFRDVVTIPSAVAAIALSADDRRIAYLEFTGDPYAYDIYVYDVLLHRTRLLASKAASPTGSLSFRSITNDLTFEDKQGRISAIDVDTLQGSEFMLGKRPRWSHDGSRLAYRNDEVVYVYDVAGRRTVAEYRRSPVDGSFDGSLFWSHDDRFLAFNLKVGIDAPTRRCVIVDTQANTVAVSVTTSYGCGPFAPVDHERIQHL